jgi:hypothetical protein
MSENFDEVDQLAFLPAIIPHQTDKIRSEHYEKDLLMFQRR